MTVRSINPLQDPRWARFLLRHPRSSIFHTPVWLEALRRTYGYEPVVLTTAGPGCELDDGLAVCQVYSYLTGRRAVSLPFSDHCEPLAESQTLPTLLGSLRETAAAERLRYVELRPVGTSIASPGFARTATFWLHTIDLRPSLDDLYRGFHKNCVQRKIRRAERESLEYHEGRSRSLLESFYTLLVLTRRRHGLVPQPFDWFQSLVDCLGDALTIRVAEANGRPVAAIITLHHKNVLVYKYGCSDTRFNRLGAMQLLFWRAIRQAKELGVEELDLGRSDTDQIGLIAFKDRWGSRRRELNYWRYPAAPVSKGFPLMEFRVLNRMIGHMPVSALIAAGKLLYRHMG